MSYNPIQKQDYLSELFSRSADFNQCSKQLIKNANDVDKFVIWFDKLRAIDQRQLRIFITDNYDKFPQNIKRYISPYLIEKAPISEFID